MPPLTSSCDMATVGGARGLLRTAAVMKPLLLVGSIFAATRAQAGDASVPEALRRIEQQTTSTAGQVADPVKGLGALHDQIAAVGSAVDRVGPQVTAAVGTDIAGVLSEIVALRSAVSALETKVDQQAGRGSRVWVAPYWRDWLSGGSHDAQFIHSSEVAILNAGDAAASVGCLFFDGGGTLLLDRGKSLTLGRGEMRTCRSNPDPVPEDLTPLANATGWVVVKSDHPVVVYGWSDREREEQDLQRLELHFYPVDCTHPAGFEFACTFSAPPNAGTASSTGGEAR